MSNRFVDYDLLIVVWLVVAVLVVVVTAHGNIK